MICRAMSTAFLLRPNVQTLKWIDSQADSHVKISDKDFCVAAYVRRADKVATEMSLVPTARLVLRTELESTIDTAMIILFVWRSLVISCCAAWSLLLLLQNCVHRRRSVDSLLTVTHVYGSTTQYSYAGLRYGSLLHMLVAITNVSRYVDTALQIFEAFSSAGLQRQNANATANSQGVVQEKRVLFLGTEENAVIEEVQQIVDRCIPIPVQLALSYAARIACTRIHSQCSCHAQTLINSKCIYEGFIPLPVQLSLSTHDIRSLLLPLSYTHTITITVTVSLAQCTLLQ